MPEEIKQLQQKLEQLQEKVDGLDSKVQLFGILIKKQDIIIETVLSKPQPEPEQETEEKKTKTIIQINTIPKNPQEAKTYFCKTNEEQQIFAQNNPGVRTETFNIELPVFVADKHLNSAENKKQFIQKKG